MSKLSLYVDDLEKALAKLDEALALNESDIVRDAVIKRFEFTFEMAWKAMYAWLRSKGVSIPKEAFEVIPRAFQAGLIENDADWDDLRKARNKTSHNYNETDAIAIAAIARHQGRARVTALLARLKAELGK